MAGKLNGKVALVTGASSGIGEATALALVNEGAQVALVARRSDRLERLAKLITDAGGLAMPIIADVADDAKVHEQVLKIKTEWGKIDILINNAGVMLLGLVESANTDDWRRMMNINVLGLMYATHAVLPIMKTQGGGHIVNISSSAGRTVQANNAVYNATKWAVGAFSEALRQEIYKDNIRITVIEPGAVATELSEHITDAAAKQFVRSYLQSITPLNSEDIAAAIVYVLTQPSHVNVNEVLIRPIEQSF